MIIYKATNVNNGKIYIGQTTKDLSIRKQEHIRRSRYEKYLTYFGKAIRKYVQYVEGTEHLQVIVFIVI